MSRMDSAQVEIAATAARMVVEEGLEYGPAKRRAVKQLGLTARTALPDNDAVEDAVRDYIRAVLRRHPAGRTARRCGGWR